MKFDVTHFTVKAGETIEVVLLNPDIMPHNLVIAALGTLDSVGAKAEAMASQAGRVPEELRARRLRKRWYLTKLISQGALARLRITAPAAPGNYPYLCSFPGHWRVMNGIMEVEQ